jgi:hypothetical protein
MAHAYNKGYAIKIVRNMMQSSKLNTSMQVTVNIPKMANMIAWNVMQSHLPSSLYYSMCFVTMPIQTDGERKPQLAGQQHLAGCCWLMLHYI